MSQEQFKNTLPAYDPEAIEKICKEKMMAFQLEYCQRMWEKKIPLPPKFLDNQDTVTFEDILTRCSDITNDLYVMYGQRGSDEDYEEFQKKVFADIHQEYDKDPQSWISRVPEILSEAINTLSQPAQVESESSDKSQHAGIIRYKVFSFGDRLKDFGFSDADQCAVVHFDSFFKQKSHDQDTVSITSLSKSFELLAQQLHQNYPEVKAIYGESWLMDSPFGAKSGFHAFSNANSGIMYGTAFWGQFIDQHGNMKEDAVKEFLQTGKPRFSVKAGYIPIDEFYAKYLPKKL